MSELQCDSATFEVTPEYVAVRPQPGNSGKPFELASVAKPLYVWAAAETGSGADRALEWSDLAWRAVTRSSNADMTDLWQSAGPQAITAYLNRVSGEGWPAAESEQSWGSLDATAPQVAAGYAALFGARDESQSAASVIGFMQEVAAPQDFGLRRLLGRTAALKAGWYIDASNSRLITNVAAALPADSRTWHGAVVVSEVPVDPAVKNAYLADLNNGRDVIVHNETHAGALIRDRIMAVLHG